MADLIDVLIMIHGMVPNPRPSDPFDTYTQFYNDLVYQQRNLQHTIADRKIYVEWGHEPTHIPAEGLRADQKLTRAQLFAHNRVSYDAVRVDPSPNNRLLTGLRHSDYNLVPRLRDTVTSIRDGIIHFGIGDAVYYCSQEGENNVRKAVYEQILTKLDQFEAREIVRLHIIGHSLGVTLSHDFLFGLFAQDHKPGFIDEGQGSQNAIELFKKWRDRAQNNTLQLGTLISSASQLPVFLMRKQNLIDKLFKGELLNPVDLGIIDEATVRWLIFYDIDDILGFTTRRLYKSTDAIMEIQVDTGDLPNAAHTGYWENQTVIRETANFIYRNTMLDRSV